MAFLGQESSFSRRAHILLSCMHGPLGHCSYHVIPPCLPRLYPSFASCFVVGLWLVHFLVNFLFQASHAYFSLLYLSQTLLANILVVPAHFIASFFGLPQAIYYLFASFTFMGFLLNPLGFLDPITTSLLFNTTWAYWFLGQPIEFTTHFLGFLGSFTPSLPLTIPMSLLFHSFNFLGPLTISLSLFIIVAMLAINSTIPACWGLLYYFPFSLSSYCWAFLTVGPFVKSGHQHLFSYKNITQRVVEFFYCAQNAPLRKAQLERLIRWERPYRG